MFIDAQKGYFLNVLFPAQNYFLQNSMDVMEGRGKEQKSIHKIALTKVGQNGACVVEGLTWTELF